MWPPNLALPLSCSWPGWPRCWASTAISRRIRRATRWFSMRARLDALTWSFNRPASTREWRPEMAVMTDNLNPPPAPQRVFYSTGRMLGASDFQADQDYHRSRLARALVQLYGTGTVAGLSVQTDGNADLKKLEVQVTPGIAIDRVGRIIEAPRMVCVVLFNWLTQQFEAWQKQQTNPVPGQPALRDPNLAIHDDTNLMCDVFAT